MDDLAGRVIKRACRTIVNIGLACCPGGPDRLGTVYLITRPSVGLKRMKHLRCELKGNVEPTPKDGSRHPISSDLMTTQDELIDRLSDIYALDKTLETALKKLSDNPSHCPAMRKQAAQHSGETRRHAEAIAAFLKQLGTDPSTLLKTMKVPSMGMDLMKSPGTAFVRDELIKDVLTVLVTEHFEIACHTILRTRAAELGLLEVVRICDQILDEEKRMVNWLQLNMPPIFAAYLAQSKGTEAEEDIHHHFRRTHQIRPGVKKSWEFVQLADNVSLFGGPLKQSAFVYMQN